MGTFLRNSWALSVGKGGHFESERAGTFLRNHWAISSEYAPFTLEETLSRLEYAAERQLFAVVTGDCGTGKTTTIRRFKESLDEAKFLVLYLADSKLTPRHFYKGLLEQLGCEPKFYRGEAKRQLHHEIELMKGIQHLQPVVVVDEGHLLGREMLEEVRFLLNYKCDSVSCERQLKCIPPDL